ncbi:hypothetical protein AHAS_Ahas19G0190000 [Arachis hypogaea]
MLFLFQRRLRTKTGLENSYYTKEETKESKEEDKRTKKEQEEKRRIAVGEAWDSFIVAQVIRGSLLITQSILRKYIVLPSLIIIKNIVRMLLFQVIKWYTICICLIDLLITAYAFYYHFQLDDPLIQLAENYKWIIFFYFYWRFGIDGLSIGPILLTGFITTIATLAAQPVTRESRLFHFLMLAMYSGQIGPFSCQDFLLFFIMWELELIPVYILLSMWGGGGKKRLYSATKFILYTAGSSIFLLMGILGIGLYSSNEPTLNFETLTNQSYPGVLEIIFYMGFLFTFAVKLPIIPLHTWLPDTHGEAHYSTCMLLAGILLKMGAAFPPVIIISPC